MKNFYSALLILLTVLLPCSISAQIVTTSPAILQSDSKNIVITFHADQGNKGLMGLTQATKVYAHTGVITDKSNGNWVYAPAWGTNTSKYQMTWIAPNTWTLSIPDITTFYGIPAGETVEKLAFVFRTADNSKEGKTESGGDIFVDVLPPGYQMVLESDLDGALLTDSRQVKFSVYTTANSDIKLYIDSESSAPIASGSGTDQLQTSYTFDTPGDFTVIAVAKSGNETRRQTLAVTRLNATLNENYPGGIPRMGTVTNPDGSVTFCLAAPGKNSAVLVGSWNGYAVSARNQMYRQEYEGNTYFWTTVSGLQPAVDYIYYFVIDGGLAVGDPYARLVLDPWNDRYIPASIFPDLPEYPEGKVQNVPLAVYNSSRDNYDWQVKDFKGVDQSDLIIYELLIRDFTGTEGKADGNGTLRGVLDKLDYIQGLGVNAIELLPIMEFNGNNSWGYNTNFYFAPDKAYGTPDDYRLLIDECHRRGLAVILDIVFNQSDGLHPWYQMYTPAKNPFYNASAPHAYSVLNDWNQDNPLVQQQWHDALAYWLTAYKVDGFRFDLVKGLGNNSSYGATYNASSNTWSGVTDAKTNAYNATRVARMKALHDAMREINPDAYFINEDLAGSQEENEMAADGETNWANINTEACQFAMGFPSNSNLNRFYAPLDGNRLWGSTVSYAESHDEERMAYKQSRYGASGVKGNTPMSMRRLGSVAAQMLMTPGAHMIWQFQEMGADQTTKNSSGNDTSPKKVIWSYLDNPDRAGLCQNYRELNAIRSGNPQLFRQGVSTVMKCSASDWANGRYIALTDGTSELFCVVNPNLTGSTAISVPMTKAASQYRILSKSFGVTPTIGERSVTLPAGAYAVIGTTDLSDREEIAADPAMTIPRVHGGEGRIIIDGDYQTAEVYTITGRRVGLESLTPGIYLLILDGHPHKIAVK